MDRDINIAIDGYSSCGKGTIAKAISNRYGMRYIDTGSMYRACTLFCIENNIISDGNIDLSLLIESIKDIEVDFQYNNQTGNSETYLNGEYVEKRIRSVDVSNFVSDIAQITQVRDKLLRIQRQIVVNKNVVMDGRDIGTNVIPFAEIKFFLTANIEVRSKRRYDQLSLNEINIEYNDVLKNIKYRDDADSNRIRNPLKMAEDAILLDNSYLSLDQQNDFVFSRIDKFISQ